MPLSLESAESVIIETPTVRETFHSKSVYIHTQAVESSSSAEINDDKTLSIKSGDERIVTFKCVGSSSGFKP
jgi:hypothetical protein